MGYSAKVSRWEDHLARKARAYGAQFDASECAPQFIPYFNSGERIEVQRGTDPPRRGHVGVTTGWRPAFLLMSRQGALGSCDVLGPDDRVVRVARRNRYSLHVACSVAQARP